MMQLMRGRRTRARLLLKKRYARIYRIRRFANPRIDSIEDSVAFQAVRLRSSLSLPGPTTAVSLDLR